MIYTLFPDMFRQIQNSDDTIYIRDLINVFGISSNPYKIAKDKKGIVIDIYSSVESKYTVFFIELLEMLSRHPSGFETIDVDIESIKCEESKFLKLCKETRGSNKMIVFSKQTICNHPIVESKIDYENTSILLYDRDEARIELNRSGNTYNIQNSQVAMNGSEISNSKNKTK